MTNDDLSSSYLIKAEKRLKILDILMKEEDYSDVVREAQEIVELAQKSILRKLGIDPPKWHDVSDIILANLELIPDEIHQDIKKIINITKWLRGEREISFYGDIDFIPTSEYDIEDARKAIYCAVEWVSICRKL